MCQFQDLFGPQNRCAGRTQGRIGADKPQHNRQHRGTDNRYCQSAGQKNPFRFHCAHHQRPRRHRARKRSNQRAPAPISIYSSIKAVRTRKRVAPRTFMTTASYTRARWPDAMAPARTRMPASSVTTLMARTANPIFSIMPLAVSNASLTRIIVTFGKARARHGSDRLPFQASW